MKIKTLPLFLLATTAAGAVLSAYLFQENRSLQTALDKASRAVGPSDEPKEIRIVEPSVAAATPAQEASEVAEPVSRRPPPDHFERFRQMREDPNFQRAMLERSKSSIERNYAGLFRALDLDEEGVEILKTLLAERNLMERQAAFQRRAVLDDPEALLKAELSLEENLAQIDRSLAEVLGEEKYATYDYYRDTLPQRQSVDELARRLSYSGTPLTEERAEVLVGVMAAAESSHTYTMDLAQLSRGERSLVTEIDVAVYLDEKERLNQMILSEAAAVLEQDQLEALAEQQMREVEQIERRASFGMGFRGGFGGPPGG